MSQMTSAERLRATCRREPTDYLPLCFEGVGHGFVSFLKQRLPDPLEPASCSPAPCEALGTRCT